MIYGHVAATYMLCGMLCLAATSCAAKPTHQKANGPVALSLDGSINSADVAGLESRLHKYDVSVITLNSVGGEEESSLGFRLNHSQKATAVTRATAERKFAASLSPACAGAGYASCNAAGSCSIIPRMICAVTSLRRQKAFSTR